MLQTTPIPTSKRGLYTNSIVFLITISTFFYSYKVYAQSAIFKKDYNPSTGIISCDTIKTTHFIIKEIIITGNQKTRDKIIDREIEYEYGDTLLASTIHTQLLWIKNRIFNTTLFLWVDITLSGEDDYHKTLFIHVKERNYINPAPTGGLLDRNFNEWWQDRNHDLKRIYIGVDFKMRNLWGLNHTLKIKAITGFNKRIETDYSIPYIDKKFKTGLIINALMEYNSLVVYRTFEHKLEYLEYDGKVAKTRYNVGFLLTRRNKFYSQHQLGPYFQYTHIADTIAALNSDFFLKSATYQRSIGLKYQFTNDKRDYINYPLKGHLLKIQADYQHLTSIQTIELVSLRAEYTEFIPLNKTLFFAVSGRCKLSIPNKQPYFSQRGLGFNKEWVNGYERYVIDGQVFGLIKTNLKTKLFSIQRTVKFIPHRKFKTIPLSVYFKTFLDAGYVKDNTFNPDNAILSNRILTGGGIGLDFVTYYDLVGRIEYSINQFGQTGIYLHLKAGL